MSSIPTVVVHGGAGNHTVIKDDPSALQKIEDGVVRAATRGYQALQAGGSAVDAVEAAVCVMEDDPIFNAGRGSSLTVDKTVEMDASIMEGASLNAGGVACIENVANPVKVARLVMEKSDHVVFVAEGAKRFAEEMGVQIIPTESLLTEKALDRLKKIPYFSPSTKDEFHDRIVESKGYVSNAEVKADLCNHDTVGAVAVDAKGNVAYATSTGGISAKKMGRCGDSPVPGGGGYCDNATGAVSTTGHGECLLRSCLAFRTMIFMEQGASPQEAVQQAVDYMNDKIDGTGGAIAVDPKGNVGVYYNTQGMSWAVAQTEQVRYGIYRGDHKVIKL